MSLASLRIRTRVSQVRALTAIGAALALAVAGCTTGSTPTPSANLPLEGTLWQLDSYVGPEGAELPVPDAVAATARFEDGTIAGSGGCNAYSGTYTLEGDELTIGPVASTQMACVGPVATLEGVYLEALGKVASYTIDDVTLLLENADGEAILTFEESVATSLTGTDWVATRVNNGNQGVVSILADTEITATFTEDGQVAGSGGCNSYNGAYTVDGSIIEVGPLATTRKLCGSPDGIDDQEAQYFAALDAATTYTILGSELELRDDSGALQVSYTAP